MSHTWEIQQLNVDYTEYFIVVLSMFLFQFS